MIARSVTRLNPFFIRSYIQMSVTAKVIRNQAVLIPSLSGHIFKYVAVNKVVIHNQVLIPSLSGHIFK